VQNPLIYWLSPSSIPEISGEPAAVCPEVQTRIILLNFVYRTLVLKIHLQESRWYFQELDLNHWYMMDISTNSNKEILNNLICVFFIFLLFVLEINV
jgi:hypothetical protein